MKYIDIEVSKEDVDQGKRMDSFSCPLALAAKRKFPLAPYISAGTTVLLVGDEFYKYSEALLIQIYNYDTDGEFIPRTYRVFKEEI